MIHNRLYSLALICWTQTLQSHSYLKNDKRYHHNLVGIILVFQLNEQYSSHHISFVIEEKNVFCTANIGSRRGDTIDSVHPKRNHVFIHDHRHSIFVWCCSNPHGHSICSCRRFATFYFLLHVRVRKGSKVEKRSKYFDGCIFIYRRTSKDGLNGMRLHFLYYENTKE